MFGLPSLSFSLVILISPSPESWHLYLFPWLDLLKACSFLASPLQYWSITQHTCSSWLICNIIWSSFQTFQINYLFIWRGCNWLFSWETQFTRVARERHSSFCSIIKSMFKWYFRIIYFPQYKKNVKIYFPCFLNVRRNWPEAGGLSVPGRWQCWARGETSSPWFGLEIVLLCLVYLVWLCSWVLVSLGYPGRSLQQRWGLWEWGESNRYRKVVSESWVGGTG